MITLNHWRPQRFQSARSRKYRIIIVCDTDADNARVTSPLAAIDGDVITTASGSRYRLGEPGRHVLDHAAQAGVTFDPADPLAFLRTPGWAFEFKGGW